MKQGILQGRLQNGLPMTCLKDSFHSGHPGLDPQGV